MADKGKIGIVLKELKSKVPQLLRSMKRHWIITSVIVVFLTVSVVALFLYEFDFEEYFFSFFWFWFGFHWMCWGSIFSLKSLDTVLPTLTNEHKMMKQAHKNFGARYSKIKPYGKVDSNYSVLRFKRNAKRLITELMTANSAEQIENLRPYFSENLINEVAPQTLLNQLNDSLQTGAENVVLYADIEGLKLMFRIRDDEINAEFILARFRLYSKNISVSETSSPKTASTEKEIAARCFLVLYRSIDTSDRQTPFGWVIDEIWRLDD